MKPHPVQRLALGGILNLVCKVGSHFKALDEGDLVATLDSRYTQVGLNFASAQVCFGTGLNS